MRFRSGESQMEKIEAPEMREMRALTLSGYQDIWFVGVPYGDAEGEVIVNYYRGTWTFHDDPTPSGMDYLHFFSHGDGWGFSDNRVYRFNGQHWYSWLEFPLWKRIKPCAFKSANDIWAVAYFADESYEGNAVVHYDGAGWHEVFKPGVNKYVYDVAMWNDYNGWAVGAEEVATREYRGRIWECRHGVWSERVCPVEENLRSVEVVSKTEAWALTSGKILHYQTGSTITPTSLGCVKALYARTVSRPDAGRRPHRGTAAPAAEGSRSASAAREPTPPDSTANAAPQAD